MKNKKTIHYLNLGALFFVIPLLFCACQKDTAITEESKIISPEGFHYSTFIDVKNLKAPVKTNTQRLLPGNNSASRNNGDIHNFSIDTMVVQTLVSNSYTSYTFIARLHEPDTTKLHNYVLTYFENDSINEMLVAYPRVYNNTNQKYDMDNITARPIDGDLSILGRAICDGYIVTSWDANGGNCVDYNCGLSGNHSPGEACEDGEYRAYTECSGAWVDKCLPPSDNDENPDGSSGGGGGSGNPDAIDIIPLEDCENSGDGEAGPNGECFIIVDDDDGLTEDNCNDLNTLLSSPTIKASIEGLNNTTNLNISYEKGFILKDDSTTGLITAIASSGTPQKNSMDVTISEDGSVFGYIHTHYNGLLPAFAIGDIKSFNGVYQWRKYNNKSLNNLTAIVVTQSGVFAMVIDDFTKFETKGNILQTEQYDEIKDKTEDKIERNTVSDKLRSIRNLIDKVLPTYGLSLYKASDDLTSWSKVDANPNNSTGTTTTPCN